MLKPFFVMLIGLVFTVVGIKRSMDDKAFEKRGKEAVVQPLESYTRITRKQGVSTRSVEYKGNLTFVTDSGQSVTVEKSIPEALLQDLQSGRKVVILYLPDDPYKNRFGTELGIVGAGEVWFFGSVFLVGLVWFRIRLKSER